MSNTGVYQESSIVSLNPLEFTRLRPGVYCGNTEYSTQLLIEIVANAIDEFQVGNGNKIDVTISDNNVISVRDYGQGFLINSIRKEDNKTVLEAAFSVLNTSAKYSDDGVYAGISLGLNGVGAKITNFLSHWLTVTSYRNGEYETINFKEGIFQNRKTGKTKELSGTFVQWQPSEEFFTHPEIDLNFIDKLYSTLVCLCSGLTITLNDKVYYSKNGISDLISIETKDREILKNRLIIDYKNGKDRLNLGLTYTDGYSSTIIPYVNTGLTDSGPHITQIKTILTREMNKFFRDKGWLKDKDTNLTGEDCQEGLFIVFNITTTNVAFDAQTKSRIVKLDMKPFIGVFAEKLQNWFEENEKEVKKICDKALSARKAREAAKKARDAIREPKKKGLKAKIALSNKFIDCANKNPEERTLVLVEGISAGSSAVEARDPKRDCIYMLRGKTVSPRKQSVDKIVANQEMSDIINIIGAGFGNTFDASKMNFSKVVIAADQDSDGSSIELLLTTFFFTFMRPLVEAGKLYRAVTPLYIMRQKNKESYAYSDKELEEWKKTTSENYELVRAKGLGELNPRDLRKVCFEQERYKRITISDIKAADDLLEVLMGSQVTPRKQYIYDNATELGFTFD